MNRARNIPITEVYLRLIRAWNNQDARGFANLFSEDGDSIGFDGSQLIGRKVIEGTLKEIFASHATASFITIVRQIQHIGEELSILRANVGMVLPGKKDIDPSKNAIQSMVVKKKNDAWEIVLFQNTPAQFHGRPDLIENLNRELRALLY